MKEACIPGRLSCSLLHKAPSAQFPQSLQSISGTRIILVLLLLKTVKYNRKSINKRLKEMSTVLLCSVLYTRNISLCIETHKVEDRGKLKSSYHLPDPDTGSMGHRTSHPVDGTVYKSQE